MKIRPYFYSVSLMVICGMGLFGLGLLALVGWHLQHPSWTELGAGYVGMVYNAAILFLLAGAALVARAFNKTTFCLWVGRLTAVVALVTLFEHLFQIKTGMDQFLFTHTLRLESVHPGRMATNSALALLCFGVGLILAGTHRRFAGRNLALGLASAITIVFGTDALLGHYAQFQLAFRWGSVPMALNSGLAFFLGGVALLAFLGRHASEEGIFSPRWLSAVAGSCVFLYAVGQWQTLISREESAVARSASLYSAHFARFLEIRLQQEYDSTVRLSKDLSTVSEITEVAWEKEIKPYLADRPFVAGAELRDSGWSRIISTGRGSRAYTTVGTSEDLIHYQKPRTRFFHKDEKKRAIIEFAIPVTEPGRPTRYLVTALDANEFITRALKTWSSPRYLVTVTSGTEEVFVSQGTFASTQKTDAQLSSVSIDGLHWFVRVRPTQSEYLAFRSFLPEVVFTLESLFALFIFLALRASESRFRLSTLMQSIDDGIIGLELDGTVGAWNAGAQRIFGYKAQEILGKPALSLLPPKSAKEATAALESAIRGESIRSRLTGVNKTGNEINLSLQVNPVRDSFGQIIGISAIARDIWTQAQKDAWRTKNNYTDPEVAKKVA